MMTKLISFLKNNHPTVIGRVESIPEAPPSANGARRGQSFLELALVLPVLLIILLGMVEVTFFIGRYLDMLDLTREAARFASVRDPFEANAATRDMNCSTPNLFDFYYDTSCLFSPPSTAPICMAACAGSSAADTRQCRYCNGLNAYFNINLDVDDVVMTVYTVKADNVVSDSHPKLGTGGYGGKLLPDNETYYWALSNTDADPSNDDQWRRNCDGEIERDLPNFTESKIQGMMEAGSPGSKGFVVVEAFYCYQQVLNAPLVSNFIPNPMRIHAYTIMPLPAAAPTATPKP